MSGATTTPSTKSPDLAALLAAVSDLPLDWIRDSLAATGTASERVRRLPADATMLLVIAMGLLRDRSIVDVANDCGLDHGDADAPPLASAAVSGARKRLGEAPMAEFAARCGRAWAHPSADAARWRGLALYGLDGSTVRVPDSAANRAHFGGQAAGGGRGISGYPLVRFVALMALRSHLLAALALGPYRGTSEIGLAPGLLAQIPERALVILDRGFLSAALLLAYARGGVDRHWLVRTKSTTRWRTVRTFAPGDELVELRVPLTARRRDPTLPMTYLARAIRYHRRGFRPQVLLSSLLDPVRWPARELVALYHERWELELGLDELKTDQMARAETLRSQTPWAVRQEIWGLMVGYNLVRRRALATAQRRGVAAVRVSFVVMLRQLRDGWLILAIAGLDAAACVDAHHRRQERRAVLPRRRSDRQYPRAVKLKISPYARKRPVACAA
jgi:hypothetical protein